MTQNNKQGPVFETQKERWLKYGANVGLASILVILLAIAITWGAQSPKVSARIDTTSTRLYSLKPQTIGIIQKNQQPIEIISLYTRTRPQDPDGTERDTTDYVQPVDDLLNEYRRKGSNITVESIDPVSQPLKVEQLIERVTNRYGGEVVKYRAVVEEYPAIAERLTALANAEVEKVKQFPELKIRDRELYNTLALTFGTVQQLPKALERTQEGINRGQKQKPPDYKGATDAIQDGMSMLSGLVGVTVENFTRFKDDPNVPEPLRAYMAGSLKNYEELKKIADELDGRITGLGELKLDDLKRSLREKDAILVLGPNDMRVISRDKVWREPQDVRMMAQVEGKPKMRFAGEQMITSAILAVTASSRPKVAFVRSGGPPLTMPGIPGFMPGGPFGMIAERLREYNFEVVDKDLSGMWAMQAQMQGGFAPPEPSEEEIKDAIWVVADLPMQQRNPMMPQPPSAVAPKLAEHLKNGGSALVLARERGSDFAEALEGFGIRIRTDAIAVHQPVTGAPASGDFVEQAQRIPFVFLFREYGDHLLTRPIRSLESALVPLVIVQTEKRDGVTTTPIIPVPSQVPAWGETDIAAALEREEVRFDKDVDLPLPLFGGAVAEKAGGGRVITIGAVTFAMDGMLRWPDEKLFREQRIYAPRFPGNSELFLNSVFYLAKMEPMIAISPAAMEVNRIADMSNGMLNFWRFGVLLIGLPGLVVVGGIVMYWVRRD